MTLERTRVVAVASGKGGVGKSSIATNLAVAFSRWAPRVDLLDADVWGFSVPRMLGLLGTPKIVHGLLVPARAHGVRAVSVGLLTEESAPVMWRGPMLHKMLKQFITDVFWDDPSLLVVDMPPGTGDVALTLAELLPAAEVVIITTPQAAAQQVAQRAAHTARQLGLALAGVVENMSWFTGDDGRRYELFGSGGGERLARQLGVPLLGRVPLAPALRRGADLGEPIMVTEPQCDASRAIQAIADRLHAAPIRRERALLRSDVVRDPGVAGQ
jgi:ATP-binding protein involved in chromosome partitioning